MQERDPIDRIGKGEVDIAEGGLRGVETKQQDEEEGTVSGDIQLSVTSQRLGSGSPS